MLVMAVQCDEIFFSATASCQHAAETEKNSKVNRDVSFFKKKATMHNKEYSVRSFHLSHFFKEYSVIGFEFSNRLSSSNTGDASTAAYLSSLYADH